MQDEFEHSRMNNRSAANQRKFKETEIFDWDVEPAEERESSFAHSTIHMPLASLREASAPRHSGRLIATGVIVALAAVVVLLVMKEFLRP